MNNSVATRARLFIATVLMSVLSQPSVHADDSDIYTGNVASNPNGTFPNVLFVLDTSGSMRSTDDTGQSRLDRMKDALIQTLEATSNVNVGLMRFHKHGGPVLYPVSYIDEVVSEPDGTIQVPISGSEDDAEEDTADGSVFLSSTQLEMVDNTGVTTFTATRSYTPLAANDDAEDGGGGDELSSPDLDGNSTGGMAIRFPNVDIPQGATIMSATLTFSSNATETGELDLEIRGEDVGTAAAFVSPTASDFAVTNRPRTAAIVPWNNVDSFSGSGSTVTSPQVRSIVQEIVDRGDWASGNALAVFLQHTGANANRSFTSFDGAASASERPTLTISFAVGATGFVRQITDSTDDAEEQSDGTMSLSSSDLEMVQEASTQTVGMRFDDVNIPAGAQILYADVTFQIDEFETVSTNLTITGEAIDNSAAFSSTNGDISSRSPTIATVSWNDVRAPAVGEPLTSPDVSGIVQELVNRGVSGNPGAWSGNAPMTFIVTGSGERTVESANGAAGAAPVLRVWYFDPASGPSSATTQVVGLRFATVNIPQGAQIESAFIDFQAAATSTDTTALTIVGEASDSASAFTATTNDISNRGAAGNATAASVAWNPPAWNIVGEVQQTPDLKDIVQEVVDRSGWCGGNAMAFVISGIGRRIARSYDFSSTDAPVLRVNYNTDSLTTGQGCVLITETSQIQSDSDDVEQRADNTMYFDSSDLELMHDGSIQDAVGLRFRNVQIPPGADVLDAYITFTTDETQSGTTNLLIHGEATNDSPAFSTSDSDVTDRTTTTASISWSNLPAWTSVGGKHDTPNLESIVEEIIGISGWASGNSMTFIIKAGTGCSSSSCRRTAESKKGDASGAPRLTIKYRGNVADGAGETTVRDELIEVVNLLDHKGGTPIVDSIYEAARYYKGWNVYYGRTRGAGDTYAGASEDSELSDSEFTRLSHPDSYVGDATIVRGPVSSPITVDATDICATNPSDIDCRTERIISSHAYVSPIEDECQTNYVVLLSDGRANNNHSASLIPTMTGAACSALIDTLDPTTLQPTGSQRSPDGGEQCGVDLVKYLQEVDQIDDTLVAGENIINTFTIGFNLSSGSDQDAIELLQEMADVGEGTFFQASSSSGLASTFQTIIQTIQKESTAFSAPGLAVNAFNRLFNLNTVYLALFEPDDTVGWNGNLKKFALCEDITNTNCEFGELIDAVGAPAVNTDPTSAEFGKLKSDAQGFWSEASDDGLAITEGGAGKKIPTYTDRKVYTYTSPTAPDPSTSPTGTSLHLIDDVSDTGTDTTTDLKQRILETASCGGTAAPDNDCLNNTLLWMLGKRFGATGPAGATANDRWAFADPMHNRPLVINFGKENNDDDKPVAKLFVATNDGGLRMINETTGVEEFMVVPQALLGIQEALKDNAGGDHIYGLDGNSSARIFDCNGDSIIDPANSPNEDCNGDGSVNSDDNDFVHLFIGMRRGGRNYYAFNVTPSSTLTTQNGTGGIVPKLLWRIEGGSTGFENLGQSWSTMRPTRIQTASGITTALVFSGGYDEGQDGSFFGNDGVGNAIYVVDADTGALLWSAGPDGSGATLELTEMTYSIPGDVTLVDSDGDSVTDRLYAVDVGGQVWRVDLAPNLSNSTAGRLAVLSDGSVAADRRKFMYAPEVALVTDEFFAEDDAQDYDVLAIISGDRADPNETVVDNRAYLLRDYLIDSAITLDGSNSPTNYPQCNSSNFCNTPLTHDDLLDVSNLLILSAEDDETVVDEPIDLLQASHGWYFDLEAGGEKGFSRATIFNGIVFFTTYIPASNANTTGCGVVVGESRLYAVDLFTGAPVFPDFNGITGMQKTDRYKSLGSGPSAEVVPAFLEPGPTLIVQTSPGAIAQDPGEVDRIRKTFWYQNIGQ